MVKAPWEYAVMRGCSVTPALGPAIRSMMVTNELRTVVANSRSVPGILGVLRVMATVRSLCLGIFVQLQRL